MTLDDAIVDFQAACAEAVRSGDFSAMPEARAKLKAAAVAVAPEQRIEGWVRKHHSYTIGARRAWVVEEQKEYVTSEMMPCQIIFQTRGQDAEAPTE